MALILVIIEAATVLAEFIGLVVALGLKDEAGFEQNLGGFCERSSEGREYSCAYLARVCVHGTEPVPEVFILLSIDVQGLHGVTDHAETLSVREPLKESA